MAQQYPIIKDFHGPSLSNNLGMDEHSIRLDRQLGEVIAPVASVSKHPNTLLINKIINDIYIVIYFRF